MHEEAAAATTTTATTTTATTTATTTLSISQPERRQRFSGDRAQKGASVESK